MTDHRLEQIVGNLLRTGVLLAAVVVGAGGIWYLAAHGGAEASYRTFRPRAVGLRTLKDLTGPQAVILIGLVLLVATPIARVVFSLVAFALEKDHTYVGITLVVLLVLLYSIGTAWL